MNKKRFMAVMIIAAGAALLSAQNKERQEQPYGREMMEKGELKTVKGTLLSRDGKTFINSSEGELELFGPRFNYKDGDTVTAEGFVYENQMKALRVTINGEVISMGGQGRGRGGRGRHGRGGYGPNQDCPYFSDDKE